MRCAVQRRAVQRGLLDGDISESSYVCSAFPAVGCCASTRARAAWKADTATADTARR